MYKSIVDKHRIAVMYFCIFVAENNIVNKISKIGYVCINYRIINEWL